METFLKSIATGFMTVTSYFLGGWDVALQTLIIFIVLDYLSGMAKAFITKKLNSTKGLQGILKKLLLLILVVVGVRLDYLAGSNGLIRNLVIYYVCANEGLSILENLSEAGILVPKSLKKYLEKIRDDSDKIDGGEDEIDTTIEDEDGQDCDGICNVDE